MKIISHSANETIKIGKIIARHLGPGDIICLFGKLGSGKTILVKGISCGLRIKKDKIVSPSFVLIREYLEGKLPLYHFDLYRLKSPSAILGLGYEEYFYNAGVTVVEWADRLEYLLPKEFLRIELSFKSNSERALSLTASGRRYQELLRKIHENLRH
jgi:tRNA threonylcarbamoyladenosine biosynthesis protein TsaE